MGKRNEEEYLVFDLCCYLGEFCGVINYLRFIDPYLIVLRVTSTILLVCSAQTGSSSNGSVIRWSTRFSDDLPNGNNRQ